MKKFARFLAVFVSVMMIFGAVSVFADDSEVVTTAADDEELVIAPAPVENATVFVTLESSDGLSYIGSGDFASDGSVSAGDVAKTLLVDHKLEGLETGYISAIDGLGAATFGGWDGWMYAVKYYVADEAGNVSLYIDIPNVGLNDYQITGSCVIVLYYADYGAPFAGTIVTEDEMVGLVTYTPVYDENYNVTSFTEAPLANGQFTLTAYTVDENGETVIGKSYVFESDENGLTKLHKDLREVPNGTYFGSVGKQSDKTAQVGDQTISLPEVVRYSDVFTVDVHPTPEELFKQKIFFLMLGMAR